MKRKTIYRMGTYLGDGIYHSSTFLTQQQFIQIKGQLETQYSQMTDPVELGAEYSCKILRDSPEERDTMWRFSYGVNEIYLYKLEAKRDIALNKI